eukprot:TRINITY_DN1097_c0_g1_i1.p1 TRINITY_DN1097_c0_g1~~TRINITY_DN1097_c0_g1_i1.p1  ORF type:complete len:229 (+),score=64.49 TRINITY_DN1097_c0_g1_i1:108-794(+)
MPRLHRKESRTGNYDSNNKPVKKVKKPSTGKRIRDLKRLLQSKKNNEMSEERRQEIEKKIKLLEKKRDENKEMLITNKNKQKYKKIRFIEQKKALRKYNQLRKKISNIDSENNNNNDDNEDINEQFMKIKKDLFYILNYPLTKRYISLYPTKKTEANKNSLEEMKNIVLESYSEVKLEQLISSITNKKVNKNKNKNNQSNKEQQEENEEEQEEENHKPKTVEEDDFFA